VGGDASTLVPAACIVDADVEIDFAPSSESEGAEQRAKAAEEERRIELERETAVKAAAEAAQAAARADPFHALNAGQGHVLGSEDSPPSEDVMSEREKRLAALQRRGL
jgi:hypothetical protein